MVFLLTKIVYANDEDIDLDPNAINNRYDSNEAISEIYQVDLFNDNSKTNYIKIDAYKTEMQLNFKNNLELFSYEKNSVETQILNEIESLSIFNNTNNYTIKDASLNKNEKLNNTIFIVFLTISTIGITTFCTIEYRKNKRKNKYVHNNNYKY